jgi:large subunit ribosomal protein L7/L12
MSEKLNTIIEQLKSLTLIEAAELVKEIEITFGVDASASFAAPQSLGISAVDSKATEVVEEKSSFDLILTDVPTDKKIAVLKIVRTLTGLGLKESKDIVDNVPKVIKEGLTKEDSEKFKKEFEEAGGKVTIK